MYKARGVRALCGVYQKHQNTGGVVISSGPPLTTHELSRTKSTCFVPITQQPHIPTIYQFSHPFRLRFTTARQVIRELTGKFCIFAPRPARTSQKITTCDRITAYVSANSMHQYAQIP